MERLLTSLFLFWLLLASAIAEPFGRFGYSKEATANGLHVDSSGLKALYAGSDAFAFPRASKLWAPSDVSPVGSLISLDTYAGSPAKARISLASAGMDLFFPLGIDMTIRSTGAPYLTWGEGSVEDGVPTPPSKWILVSFRSKQPPVLFGFLDGPTSLIVTGGPGNWHLRSELSWSGWIRVAMPIGERPVAATTASSLGELAQAVSKDEDFWLQPQPKLVQTSVEADEESITATWSFDRAGAIVPLGALFARQGGYPLQFLTPLKRVFADSDLGPLTLCEGSTLSIRFPARRIPTGRGLAIGSPYDLSAAPVTPTDVPSVCQLALENLTSLQSEKTRELSSTALTSYLQSLPSVMESWTGQNMPFGEDAKAVDQVAAQALLMQAMTSTDRATSEQNSLLTSLWWKTDWDSWLPWGSDAVVVRRAGGIGCVAATLCPEPDRRLMGAMWEAGLCAQRGYQMWQRTKGVIKNLDVLIEPFEGVRKSLYSLSTVAVTDPMVNVLLSQLRLYGDTTVSVAVVAGSPNILWDAKGKGELIFSGAYPADFMPGDNLAGLQLKRALGFIQATYQPIRPGRCQIILKIPDWAQPLPELVHAPQYQESTR